MNFHHAPETTDRGWFQWQTALPLALCVAVLFAVTHVSRAGKESTEMARLLANAVPGEPVSVILSFPQQQVPVNLSRLKGMSPTGRMVTLDGMRKSSLTRHQPLFDQLHAKAAAGNAVAYRNLWLVDAVAVKATSDVLADVVASFPDATVTPDAALQIPVSPLADGSESGGPTDAWNLDAIRARETWALGFRGTGVVIATVDTGVDALHPDLAVSGFRGHDAGWCDVTGTETALCSGADTPNDLGSAGGHGTGVMGVIVGGDATGVPIGVAPEASWIAARIFDADGNANLSAALDALQWLLTLERQPDIINMSWEVANVNAGNTCTVYPLLEQAMVNLRDVGIFLVASSGNDNVAHLPAGYRQVFAVGATNPTGYLWDFSGVGPTTCPGRGAVNLGGKPYPNAVAPGDGLVTADLSSGGLNVYQALPGTSTAGAHVSGAAALLLQAYPSLTVDELEDALSIPAVATGDQTQVDDNYGYGLIDVRGSLDYLLNIRPARPSEARVILDGSTPTVMWNPAPTGSPAVTFRILRDGVEIASGITGNTFVDTSGNNAATYSVVAVNATDATRVSDASHAVLGNVNRLGGATENRVDAFDLVAVTANLGTTGSDPNWDPMLDANNDGIVDLLDVDLVTAQIGTTVNVP